MIGVGKGVAGVFHGIDTSAKGLVTVKQGGVDYAVAYARTEGGRTLLAIERQ